MLGCGGTLEVILKVSYKAVQAIRIVVFGCAGYTHLHRKIRLTQLCVELSWVWQLELLIGLNSKWGMGGEGCHILLA